MDIKKIMHLTFRSLVSPLTPQSVSAIWGETISRLDPVGRVCRRFVLVLLVSIHKVYKSLSVYTSFGVAIGSHVTGVTPLYGVDESEL